MLRWLLGGTLVLVAGYLLMPFLPIHHDPFADGQEKQRVPFAIDRAPPEVVEVPFDGKRAIGYLEAVCALGPRMSGTPSMQKQQELIRKHFEKLGAKVQAQDFTAKQVSQKKSVAMTNLIVSFHPESKRRIILCSHYDTRPIADQESDQRRWRQPFISANDGGSGVAFLMELGNHVKKLKLNVGVDFVFFDGEEYIFDHDRDRYFFGSEHFAAAWRKSRREPAYVGAVLLDMIAGKDAKFPVEGHSWLMNRDFCVTLWNIAAELHVGCFKREVGERVMDDHLALQTAGIPAVDLIDFSYPHWHRLTDLPKNCSADSMVQVGKVLSTWMQRVK